VIGLEECGGEFHGGMGVQVGVHGRQGGSANRVSGSFERELSRNIAPNTSSRSYSSALLADASSPQPLKNQKKRGLVKMSPYKQSRNIILLLISAMQR